MIKILVKQWYRNALLPLVEEKCVLLLDSWTGHKDETVFKEFFPGQTESKLQIIPSKTTAHIQPLDVYFGRSITMENFCKKNSRTCFT